jgi:hypothetical protein
MSGDGKRQKRGYNLVFGAGIALGFATCGEVGFEGRYDYAAIGAVTNLASRLADKAAAEQILITQRLYAEVEDVVKVERSQERGLRVVLGRSKVVFQWPDGIFIGDPAFQEELVQARAAAGELCFVVPRVQGAAPRTGTCAFFVNQGPRRRSQPQHSPNILLRRMASRACVAHPSPHSAVHLSSSKSLSAWIVTGAVRS